MALLMPGRTDVVLVRGRTPPRPLSRMEQRRALRPREREVLRELASGQRTQDVATVLGITEQTVKNHRTNAFRKLGVTNIITAFRRLGWLRLPDD